MPRREDKAVLGLNGTLGTMTWKQVRMWFPESNPLGEDSLSPADRSRTELGSGHPEKLGLRPDLKLHLRPLI